MKHTTSKLILTCLVSGFVSNSGHTLSDGGFKPVAYRTLSEKKEENLGEDPFNLKKPRHKIKAKA